MIASAINRFSEEKQLDMQAIMDMQGTPQRRNPGKPGLHIPIQTRLEPEVPVDMDEMRPARNEETTKRTYLEKYHFEEHGYTEDCEGCSRLSAGIAARSNTEDCRKRMYEAMRKTEKAGNAWGKQTTRSTSIWRKRKTERNRGGETR